VIGMFALLQTSIHIPNAELLPKNIIYLDVPLT